MRNKLITITVIVFLVLGFLSTIPVKAEVLYNITGLGTFGGASSYGSKINDSGQVTGTYNTASGESHAFLWSNGVMADLGTFNGWNTGGGNINDNGQIIGTASSGNGEGHLILWSNGEWKELNTLISPNSGWALYAAGGINNLGQITGYGSYNGQIQAFVLTPVPEPATLLLIGFGAMLLGKRKL